MIPLILLLKRHSKRVKPKYKIRPIKNSKSQAQPLALLYMRIIYAWVEQFRTVILPTYTASLSHRDSVSVADVKSVLDGVLTIIDTASSLDHIFDVSTGAVDKVAIEIKPELQSWANRLEAWHRKKWIDNTKTATQVDITSVIGPEGATEVLTAAVAANVDLISSVSDDMKKRISVLVWNGFTGRTSVDTLAAQIQEQVDIETRRAQNIANDQMGKLSAALDQERQRELGFSQFIWIHSGAEHPREEHLARDGEIFSWDDPELDGDLPGMAINCGCKAQAYLDDGSSSE